MPVLPKTEGQPRIYRRTARLEGVTLGGSLFGGSLLRGSLFEELDGPG